MKTFKSLLEAIEKKLKRIEQAYDSAETKVAKLGNLEPEDDGYYDTDKMAGIMQDNPDHPALQKMDQLQAAIGDAQIRHDSRIVRIADQLKERNPDRYNELAKQIKPSILAQNQKRIDKLTERLKGFKELYDRTGHKNFLKTINQTKQELDDVSDSIGEKTHKEIGYFHGYQMKKLYKP